MKKYQDLAGKLCTWLSTLNPGDMLPPEADLMIKFDASRNTLRSAMALLRKDGLIASRSGFGTQLLRRHRIPATVSLVQVILPDQGDSFWYGILEGINAALLSTNYRVVFNNSYDDPVTNRELVEQAAVTGMHGVIMIGHHHSYEGWDPEAIEDLPPIVYVDNPPPNHRGAYVATDDEAGGYAITRHIIDAGHKKILHLAGHNCPSHQARLQGYIRAMRDAGLEFDIAGGHSSQKDGEKAAAWLLKERAEDLPTAVLGCNDHVSIGLALGLKNAGIQIPEQISVAGYADIDGAMLKAGIMLTTVRQDAQAIGRAAAELLLKKLTGQRADRPVFLPVHLIDRGSIHNLKNEAKASRKKS